MEPVNNHAVQHATSLDSLATLICGFGSYAYHKDDRDYPIPKEAVREYLETGAAFQNKQTEGEPKPQKLKQQWIERACEWLIENICYDDCDGNMEWVVSFADGEEMIEDFIKHMADTLTLEQKNSAEQHPPLRRELFYNGITTTTDDAIPLHMQKEEFGDLL